MKRYITLYALLVLTLGMGFVSCEEYLDKEPASDVSPEAAFSDFIHFQGYVEEIYNRIPDYMKRAYNTSWNWGDDEIMSAGQADGLFGRFVDRGEFRNWQTGNNGMGNWLWSGDDPGVAPTGNGNDRWNHGLWTNAWYCIRKANMGIENLDKMVGTDEERDLIEGQLYFFRAWWHFEMMMFWGGLPYIDQVLDGGAQLNLPRLSYQECADKAAADFRRAADLLPINWDDTAVGKNTLSKNQLRINKIMALGYLGKNYLWAASPLMKNGAQLGGLASGMTYDYDNTYAQQAATALGELLSLVESGQTQYALAAFDYSDIYNHTKTAGVTTSYTEIFYTLRQSFTMPGSTEAIFRGPTSSKRDDSPWNTAREFGPHIDGLIRQDAIVHLPTANAVDMYGMANGLPLDDPDSEFDPSHPFQNRDPRFYHDIVFDGFKYVNGTLTAAMEYLRYASLWQVTENNRGAMRTETSASRTGYFIQKLAPHTVNESDLDDSYGSALQMYIPYMRLADIYLMYAEACAVTGGAAGKSSNFSKTAADAINTLRERVGAGPVADKYLSDRQKFIDEVRRERAVELMFEGHRFNDLQRWLLLTEKPYSQKFAQDFARAEADEWFTENDPKDARVTGWENGKREILTRPFGTKHYWFPFPDNDTYLYPEFAQNPGW